MKSTVDVTGDPGSMFAPIGSLDWAKWVRRLAQEHLRSADVSVELLESNIDEIRRHEAWKLLADRQGKPFRSYDDFCKARWPYGLEKTPQEIHDLIQERKRITAEKAAEAKPSIPPGSNPRAENGRYQADPDRVDPVNSVQGGHSSMYLASRLARERPDIIERMKRGEFRSVKEAARKAGIIPAEITIQVHPEKAARLILKRFTNNQVDELIDWLTKLREPAPVA